MKKNLKKEIENGKFCFGLYVTMSDTCVVEMASLAGYDFIRIDWEHSLISEEKIYNLIRTANLVNLPVFVRVSSLSEVTRLLDAGATGIMVPHINSRDSAEEAVKEVKYAPLGMRGMYGTSPCLNFGQIKLSEYQKEANEKVFLIAQIEDRQGVDQIDEILSVEGIDMVATGKNDLSQSYGYAGQPNHPDILYAEELVVRKALEYGKVPTLLANSKERVKQLQKMGVRCFMTGRDCVLLFDAMKTMIETYVYEKN